MSRSNIKQFEPKPVTKRIGLSQSIIPLDLDWLSQIRVNRSAVERRCAALSGRRTVKKQWQAAWLLRAMTCIDLTTLDGADTPANVNRLCAKARLPLRPDIAQPLDAQDLTVGAVCVYPTLVNEAVPGA